MITKEEVETAIRVLRAYIDDKEMDIIEALRYDLMDAIEQACGCVTCEIDDITRTA